MTGIQRAAIVSVIAAQSAEEWSSDVYELCVEGLREEDKVRWAGRKGVKGSGSEQLVV